jgi:putative serine protease PepD
VVLAVGLATSSGVAGAYAATGLRDRDTAATTATTATATGPAASTTALSTGDSLATVAAAVQPSVVSILVAGMGQEDEGSGVILQSNGVILTNNHVVAAAEPGGQITVKFSDGRTAGATLLGSDPAADIAVIQAHGVSGLKAATLGDSDNLQVGDTVLAVGSPLGLDGSVTAGIVSALHRSLNGGNGSSVSLGDAIQTDAAINPGNSGGPLVNGAGQVVGIDTAIASLSHGSGNIGVGFAIPINHVKQIANQLT